LIDTTCTLFTFSTATVFRKAVEAFEEGTPMLFVFTLLLRRAWRAATLLLILPRLSYY
jgi:hypothetical protein